MGVGPVCQTLLPTDFSEWGLGYISPLPCRTVPYKEPLEWFLEPLGTGVLCRKGRLERTVIFVQSAVSVKQIHREESGE